MASRGVWLRQGQILPGPASRVFCIILSKKENRRGDDQEMSKHFGTDGFRGEANVDLTVEHAFLVGRYLGWHYGQDGHPCRVVIGKDTNSIVYQAFSDLIRNFYSGAGGVVPGA